MVEVVEVEVVVGFFGHLEASQLATGHWGRPR